MIYSKKASFPYPIYMSNSTSYNNPYFAIDIEVSDLYSDYVFKGSFELDSDFIKGLIKGGKAEVYFVIQSKDNKFYEINENDFVIKIPKSRISLSKRTSVQLLIMTKQTISFSENHDLDHFYMSHKDEINVPKNSLLALSNVIYFDGDIKRPYDIFEKKLNPDMKEAIRFELTEESIVINYKKDDYQFSSMNNKNVLNYPYIYTGLQKALHAMIRDEGDDEGYIDLTNHSRPSGLYLKLYNLMHGKNVQELSYDNVDEVIYDITDGIIEKYVDVVTRMEN